MLWTLLQKEMHEYLLSTVVTHEYLQTLLIHPYNDEQISAINSGKIPVISSLNMKESVVTSGKDQ